jgi:hypothetical protein
MLGRFEGLMQDVRDELLEAIFDGSPAVQTETRSKPKPDPNRSPTPPEPLRDEDALRSNEGSVEPPPALRSFDSRRRAAMTAARLLSRPLTTFDGFCQRGRARRRYKSGASVWECTPFFARCKAHDAEVPHRAPRAGGDG